MEKEQIMGKYWKKRFRPDFYFSKKWIRKICCCESSASINRGSKIDDKELLKFRGQSSLFFSQVIPPSSRPLPDQNQCKKDLDSNVRGRAIPRSF